MILQCLAIDDEPLALNIIRKYVADIPELRLTGTCVDAISGMTLLKKEQVDLLFLDINMPKLSGISLVKTLKNPPMVIFTTAYPEYAVVGFELEAVDYLLKPFSFERFLRAVQKAIALHKSMQTVQAPPVEHLYVKSDKKLFRIPFDDILYLEAYGDYVKLHTKDKMLLTKQKLSVMFLDLPAGRFVQIHRSFVISVKHIDFLEGNSIQLAGKKLPVSKGHRETVLQLLDRE